MKTKFTFLLMLISIFSFAQNEFITVWNPIQNATGTKILFAGIGTNYTIYWEEVGKQAHNGTLNNVTTVENSPILIDFGTGASANSQYILKVSNGNGTFTRFKNIYPANNNNNYYLKEIKQWGNIKWTSMAKAFYNCSILNVTATDIPDLSIVTDLSSMFDGCSGLAGNASFSLWDTSNVTNMSSMFGNSTFNFNQNIGTWNTSKVTNMSRMFAGCRFDQNIGNWDTSNVTDMSGMFSSAAFNQNIGNWNTSKITTMESMFYHNQLFNQDIGNWDTSNVTSMTYMFMGAVNFNQDIGRWNTSKVNTMESMFSAAQSFNQNIGNWDTSSLRSMRHMFSNSTFNQNIGNWNLKNVTTMDMLFNSCTISCQNYDKILIGWANNPNTRSNISAWMVGPTYSSPQAVTARSYLINTKKWTLFSDTYNPNCALATQEDKINKIQIYPNPANDFIKIENLKNNTDLEIYDMQGKLIKKEKYKNSQVSIKNLLKGIYILKIPSENYSQKLIVE